MKPESVSYLMDRDNYSFAWSIVRGVFETYPGAWKIMCKHQNLQECISLASIEATSTEQNWNRLYMAVAWHKAMFTPREWRVDWSEWDRRWNMHQRYVQDSSQSVKYPVYNRFMGYND